MIAKIRNRISILDIDMTSTEYESKTKSKSTTEIFAFAKVLIWYLCIARVSRNVFFKSDFVQVLISSSQVAVGSRVSLQRRSRVVNTFYRRRESTAKSIWRPLHASLVSHRTRKGHRRQLSVRSKVLLRARGPPGDLTNRAMGTLYSDVVA